MATPETTSSIPDNLTQVLRRYRTLSEMTSDYFYTILVAPNGEITHEWMSDSFQRITGYTADELGYTGVWTQLVHPDDQPILERAFAALLAGQRSVEEYRIITRNGDIRYQREYGRPEFDEHGRVIRIYGAAQDITQQHQAEAALRASERNLRLIAENTADCISAYDMDRHLIYVNSAFEQLTGYSIADLWQQQFIDYMHPDDRERMFALFDDAFGGVAFHDVEHRIITRDGLIKWCASSSGPLLDDQGQQIGVQGRERDITARVRAEHEYRAVERKLQETQRLESLGVLAGGIAHDFNNLLQTIQGNANLALIETDQAEQKHALQQITAASRRAAELVQQLLAYAGKSSIVMRPLDVNAVVREMTSLLRVSVPRSIEIEYVLADQLPLVEADSSQMRQVIMNLITNAAEAIQTGRGTVQLTTSMQLIHPDLLRLAVVGADLPPGRYLVAEVRDDGIGMDAATLARIFEPFFTTKFTGRGLGLAAVLGIVRAHHGALLVDSTPGTGTTFRLILPPSRNTPALLGTPSVPTGRRWSGETVLIIDDDEAVRSVVTRALAHVGLHPLQAPDGNAGLELFALHQAEIQCVLLDLMLPGMSGDQIARALWQRAPATPIVLMSGYAQRDMRARLPEAEHLWTLQKPFTPDVLYELLQLVLAPK